MLDSIQTSVVSAYAKTTLRRRPVGEEHFRSILVKAVCAAASQEISILIEFDDGSHISKKLPIGASLYIGRTTNAAAEASDCHIFNDEVDTIWRKVSALHCNIKNERDGVKLRDTSTNGTWVNGEKIKKDSAIKLENGDKVKLYNAKDEETVASAKFTVKFIH